MSQKYLLLLSTLIDVSDVQLIKAPSPISITFLGITIFTREVHSEKHENKYILSYQEVKHLQESSS